MEEKKNELIKIIAEPAYLEDESEPSAEQFVWIYQITIQNQSNQVVKLNHRHWLITNSRGITHEVKGEGVVGVQPILMPGEIFSYVSGTVLSTPSGIMTGTYEMEEVHKKQKFMVQIPAFSLDSPHETLRFQ